MDLPDLLALLRRPMHPGAAPAKPSGKGKAVPPEEIPVTEAELGEALADMAQNRDAALSTINAAGERRETLLMQPGSDAEILALGQEVDRASLVLERLERLAPELQGKLQDFRDATRSARFLELRDAHVTAGRTAIAHYRATAPDWATFNATHSALMVEYATVGAHLPNIPEVTPEQVDAYEERLRQFSHLAFNPRPAAPLPAALGKRMQAENADPAHMAAMWGSDALAGLQEQVWVEAVRRYQGPDGAWVERGATFTLPGDRAEKMRNSGCVRYTSAPEAGA